MKKNLLNMNMTDLLVIFVNSISNIWPLSLTNKYAKHVPYYCCGRSKE